MLIADEVDEAEDQHGRGHAHDLPRPSEHEQVQRRAESTERVPVRDEAKADPDDEDGRK